MGAAEATNDLTPRVSNNSTENVTYNVFVNDRPPQEGARISVGAQDRVYSVIPLMPVIAVMVAGDRFTL
jgi:hypothetical protein